MFCLKSRREPRDYLSACLDLLLQTSDREDGFLHWFRPLDFQVMGACRADDRLKPLLKLNVSTGAAEDRLIAHLSQGGAWCNNATTCLSRKSTRLGSSTKMVKTLSFFGMLRNKPQFNPDLYDWNKVKVRYCDGSSFTGDIEAVNPETKLYYMGARVFLAIVEDLLEKGMKNSKYVLFFITMNHTYLPFFHNTMNNVHKDPPFNGNSGYVIWMLSRWIDIDSSL